MGAQGSEVSCRFYSNFTAADHSKAFACVFPVKVIFDLTLFSLTVVI